ncbi:MAG TPA: hypothetical protein VML00_11875 [Bacteroidota bacterium]|nr:hypothetical protein [Bacteroidota bacterium]
MRRLCRAVPCLLLVALLHPGLHAAAAEGGPVRLLVFHVGLRGTEMDALEDLNTFGLKEMSAHREAELRALTSPDFRRLLEAKRVRLQTYADMKASVGAGGMKRPAGD